MTLEEAIAHAKEVAEENRKHSHWKITDTFGENCIACAEQHEQLAEWLEELKFLRQWKEDIIKDFCNYDSDTTEEIYKCGIYRGVKDLYNYLYTEQHKNNLQDDQLMYEINKYLERIKAINE